MELHDRHLISQLIIVICIQLLVVNSSPQEPTHSVSNVPRYSYKEYSYVALPKYVSLKL